MRPELYPDEILRVSTTVVSLVMAIWTWSYRRYAKKPLDNLTDKVTVSIFVVSLVSLLITVVLFLAPVIAMFTLSMAWLVLVPLRFLNYFVILPVLSFLWVLALVVGLRNGPIKTDKAFQFFIVGSLLTAMITVYVVPLRGNLSLLKTSVRNETTGRRPTTNLKQAYYYKYEARDIEDVRQHLKKNNKKISINFYLPEHLPDDIATPITIKYSYDVGVSLTVTRNNGSTITINQTPAYKAAADCAESTILSCTVIGEVGGFPVKNHDGYIGDTRVNSYTYITGSTYFQVFFKNPTTTNHDEAVAIINSMRPYKTIY